MKTMNAAQFILLAALMMVPCFSGRGEVERVYASGYPSLGEAADAAAGKTLVIDKVFILSGDTTLTVSNGLITAQAGGRIIGRPGITVTFASPFSVPPIPLFAGRGCMAPGVAVRFASVKQICPEWWGAAADGKTDNASAFQRMFDSTFDPATGSYQVYTFQPGRYLLKSTVTLDPVPASDEMFGMQTAPRLLGAATDGDTVFVKNTGGPMFVIGGTCQAGSDEFRLDAAARARPRNLTVERIWFISTLSSGEIRQIRPMGIVGESQSARIDNSVFTGLWTGLELWGDSASSVCEGCMFDCYKAGVWPAPNGPAFVRCQFR